MKIYIKNRNFYILLNSTFEVLNVNQQELIYTTGGKT